MARANELDALKQELKVLWNKMEEMDSRSVKSKLGDYKDKVMEYEQKAEDKIADYPMQSLGIAFGAGALAALIAGGMLRK